MMASSSNVERNKTLEAFFKANYRQLVNKVKSRAGSMESAEDVVQDAFERATKYWDSYTPDAKPLGAWFNTIMNNALRAKMNDEKNFGMSMEFDEEIAEGVEMSQTDVHMVEMMREEISKKSIFHQEVLSLYFLKQYNTKSITEILDAKLRAVEQCITRFKADIKERYGVDMT